MNRIGIFILQVAVALVFIWFGIDKLFHPDAWIYYLQALPSWMRALMYFDDKTVMLISAIVEILLGFWVLIPWKNYIPAFAIVLYFIPVLVSVGFDTVGVRDLGLMISSLALAFLLLPKKAEL